jgi:hypothetical protein
MNIDLPRIFDKEDMYGITLASYIITMSWLNLTDWSVMFINSVY